MRKLRFVVFVIVGMLCFTALAQAAIPRIINYQGKFTDKKDNPLSGNYLVTFRFYEVASGGRILWEEGHILTLKNGVFNALLGSIKPFDIEFNKDLWLGVEISSDGEMSPRIKLTSSAYAMNAQTIDTIESSQLVRNDVDAVMSGALTLRKDLILKGNRTTQSKIVMSDAQGREYYLWMDNSGNLRLKQGLPGSDRDGSIIGKETSGAGTSGIIQSVTLVLLIVAVLILALLLYSRKKQ
jgi:hypothetical protein